MKQKPPGLFDLLFFHLGLFFRALWMGAFPEALAVLCMVVFDMGLLYLVYGLPITLIVLKEWGWLAIWALVLMVMGAGEAASQIRQTVFGRRRHR
jgi:hypothetical protein